MPGALLILLCLSSAGRANDYSVPRPGPPSGPSGQRAACDAAEVPMGECLATLKAREARMATLKRSLSLQPSVWELGLARG